MLRYFEMLRLSLSVRMRSLYFDENKTGFNKLSGCAIFVLFKCASCLFFILIFFRENARNCTYTDGCREYIKGSCKRDSIGGSTLKIYLSPRESGETLGSKIKRARRKIDI